ncbi:MAG: hypothetical protein COA42_18485, partial [Alteromonadaceae bacterium]
NLDALSKAQAAEINNFSQLLKSEKGDSLIATANLITGSGISDLDLLKQIGVMIDKAFSKHMQNPRNNDLGKELNALLRAHTSFGNNKSHDYLDRAVDRGKSSGVRNRALRLKNKVYWFKERNSTMQQADHYEASQHIMTHRYINLITSNNYSLRRWGLEELSRQENGEDIVFDTIRKILKKEMLQIRSNLHLDSLAWMCKTLARSDTENSRSLLTSIVKNRRVSKKLRKYAKIR